MNQNFRTEAIRKGMDSYAALKVTNTPETSARSRMCGNPKRGQGERR
jgi:hypothetical protein